MNNTFANFVLVWGLIYIFRQIKFIVQYMVFMPIGFR